MMRSKESFLFSAVLLFLILIGLVDSSYLFWTHIKNYTDISYQSFCAISKAINCDTVSQSSWSILWGLPLSVWGILGYLFLLVVLFQTKETGCGRRFLFFISGFFSLFSIFLAIISAYKIRSYCLMCVLSYAVNFLILYFSYKHLKQFDNIHLLRGFFKDFVFIKESALLEFVIPVFIFVIILIYSFMPKYWEMSFSPMPANVKHGFENDSRDPWIGAENPTITIYEYTDYLCFQCRKMHHHLRKLVDANPEKIRLVHINYPLDQGFNAIVVPEQFHEGSGKLALLSEYASDRDDFWKINDALFELARLRGPISVGRISEVTGLSANEISLALHHPYFRESLEYDVLRGLKKRIVSTPSYFIDGVLYEGVIPAEVFLKAGIK